MNSLLHRAREFVQSENGPSSTEYAFMLAMIIVVAVGAISSVGGGVASVYASLTDSIPN